MREKILAVIEKNSRIWRLFWVNVRLQWHMSLEIWKKSILSAVIIP